MVSNLTKKDMVMKHEYPTFTIAEHAEVHLTRVNVKDVDSLPTNGQVSIIVYHRWSRKYYAAKSSNPRQYFTRLLASLRGEDDKLPGILAELSKNNDQFDFAYCNIRARNEVEHAMLNRGYMRVVTPKGSLVNTDHVIFRVYSRTNKVTRYVSCSENSEVRRIVSRANRTLIDWMTKDVFDNLGARHAMRRDFKHLLDNRIPVLSENDCAVDVVVSSRGMLLKYLKKEVERLNSEACKGYIPIQNEEIALKWL